MMRTRWAVVSLLVLVILAGGGYAALWHWGARQAEAATRAWLADQRRAGWQAEVESLVVDGFPGRIQVQARGLHLAPPAGESAVAWRWEGEGLRVHALPWSLRRPTVEPLGTQHVTLPDAAGGDPITHAVTAQAARLDLDLDARGRLAGFALEAADVTARPQDRAGDAITLESLSAALEPHRRSGQIIDLREPSHTLRVDARGLTVPPALEPPLGPRAETLEIQARVLGPLTLDPERSLHDTLQQWRDDGGTIEIDRFYLNWAPLEMSTAGSLALDHGLQPVAAMTARFQGFFAAVNRLEEVGVVRPREASVARVVLGVMAQRNPAGGAPLLSVPLTIQDRTVRVGPVLVLTFEPIRWGGRAPAVAPEVRPGFEVDRWGNVIRRE